MSQLYEKQINWRRAILSKNSIQLEEKLNSTDPTFTPTFYTSTSKTLEKKMYEKPSTHREDINKTRKCFPRKQQSSYMRTTDSSVPLNVRLSSENYVSNNDTIVSDGEPAAETADHEYGKGLHDEHAEEEPIVEVLERERREWHEERVKLIHCIHMQQLELAQRSNAAQEKATEIAKDFAQTIESFEERLVGIEDTVQKEIMAIKSIAESLQLSVTSLLNKDINPK